MCFKNEKMQKLLNWFSILTLVTTTFMILVVGYWSLYPIVPAKISSIHVVQDKVEAGKPLTLEITYCKYVNITPNITTAFVDGVIFYLNDTQLTVPEGCGINNVVINVPQEMASGTYSIRRTWVYPEPWHTLSHPTRVGTRWLPKIGKAGDWTKNEEILSGDRSREKNFIRSAWKIP